MRQEIVLLKMRFSVIQYMYVIQGRDPKGRPGTYWRDYVSCLAWEYCKISQEVLESINGVREVWDSLLDMLHPQLDL